MFEPRIHALAKATIQAAGTDPTIDAINQGRMQMRFRGMREVVARIEADGRLAPDWDIDTATAFVWALTAPTTFDLLVDRHGWSAAHWAASTKKLLRDAIIQ